MQSEDHSVKFNFGLFVLLIIIGVNSLFSSKKNVSGVDILMVEKGLQWVSMVRAGAEEKILREFFQKEIVETNGAQAILHYWSAKKDWDREGYYFYVLGNIGKKKEWLKNIHRDIPVKWRSRSKRLWRNFLKKPGIFKKRLEEIKGISLKERAVNLAKKYLPEFDCQKVKLDLIIFGYSMAFSEGDRCVFDFLQIPTDKKGRISEDELIETFAHEIHHLGFNQISSDRLKFVSNKEYLSLVGLLAGEGIPTYYIDKPFEKIKIFNKRKDILYKEIAKDWEEHSGRLEELYEESENDIKMGLNGELSLKAIRWKWDEGVKGAVYVLGSDMIRVIDKYSGKVKVLELVKDYRKLLLIYNNAAKAGNRKGGDYYVYSKNLANTIACFSGN